MILCQQSRLAKQKEMSESDNMAKHFLSQKVGINFSPFLSFFLPGIC